MELRKFFCFVAAAACLAVTAPAGAELDCENRNLNIAATTPTSAFEINGDGTVTDRRTQLQWMQCHLGQVSSADYVTAAIDNALRVRLVRDAE